MHRASWLTHTAIPRDLTGVRVSGGLCPRPDHAWKRARKDTKDTDVPGSNLTAEARHFLEELRFAVIATNNADGSPHQTVVWYLLRGADIVMNTARGRV